MDVAVKGLLLATIVPTTLQDFVAFIRRATGETKVQLGLYKTFVRKLVDNPLTLADNVRIFRTFKNEWFENTEMTPISDLAMIAQLNSALSTTEPSKVPRSKKFYVSLPELKAVVEITTAKSARKSTIDRTARHISDTLQNATEAYGAAHHELTGLLKRRGLQELILQAMSVAKRPSATSNDAESPSVPSTIGLLALDIDNFKQVNDSNTHDYGDLVLRTFAARLDRYVSNLKASGALSHFEVTIAHPSGEEFFILVFGSVTSQEISDFADNVRKQFDNNPLPSDEEWSAIRSDYSPTFRIPSLRERSISVSIGVATVGIPSDGHAQDTMTRLFRESEAAMYRAKTGGRNRVRLFSEILSRHGRVLQHHSAANTIAIDIGYDVGLSIGQQFHVYHPDFTGIVPFKESDGRTEKIVGLFPKVSFGKLTAFDVQRDIAFCTLEDARSNEPIPRGAHLEAIPFGSVTKLITSGSGTISTSIPLASSANVLQHLETAELEKYVVSVVALQNIESLERERGSEYVTAALTRLCASIAKNFPYGSLLAQTQVNELVIVADSSCRVDDALKNVHDELTAEFQRLLDLEFGIFDVRKFGTSEDDASELSARHAIEYARYALLVPGDGVYHWFDSTSAANILWESRRNQRFDIALADYKKLREIGIRNGLVENHAALAAVGDTPDAVLALEAIANAIQLAPEKPVFVANRAFIFAVIKNFPDADDSIIQAVRQGLPQGANTIYTILLLHALQRLVEAGKDFPTGIDAPGWLSEGDKLMVAPDLSDETKGRLRQALLTVRTRVAAPSS